MLDLLFREFPERFEFAQAHLQKALCLLELGQHETAIAEFRLSLQTQREFPNVGTACWLQFPWFIVRQNLVPYYEEALSVLEEFKSDSGVAFPLERYQYAAVRAPIAESQGEMQTARAFATVALQSETASSSGFRYHPTLGLVEQVDPEIHCRLAALVVD